MTPVQAVHPARGWGASGQAARDMSSGGLLAGRPPGRLPVRPAAELWEGDGDVA